MMLKISQVLFKLIYMYDADASFYITNYIKLWSFLLVF